MKVVKKVAPSFSELSDAMTEYKAVSDKEPPAEAIFQVMGGDAQPQILIFMPLAMAPAGKR